MVMPYPLCNYCVSPYGEPDVTRFAREQTSAGRIHQVKRSFSRYSQHNPPTPFIRFPASWLLKSEKGS